MKLAQISGVNFHTLEAIERRNVGQPRIRLLRKLGDALVIPVTKLLAASAGELHEDGPEMDLARLPDFRTYVKLLFPDDAEAMEELAAVYKAKMRRGIELPDGMR